MPKRHTITVEDITGIVVTQVLASCSTKELTVRINTTHMKGLFVVRTKDDRYLGTFIEKEEAVERYNGLD